MEISRERLEELIDKGATIWYVGKDYSVNANRMVDIRLGKFNKIENDYLLVKSGDGFHTPRYNFVAYLDELFETRKQAEWQLKYHATRTEELNLPMWEDFKKTHPIKFVGKDKNVYAFYYDYLFDLKLIVYNTTVYRILFCRKPTKENYTKACDLCLKLFKEEEE